MISMTKYFKDKSDKYIFLFFGYSKIILKSAFWNIVSISKLACSPQMCAADIVAPLTINYFRHGGYRQAYP